MDSYVNGRISHWMREEAGRDAASGARDSGARSSGARDAAEWRLAAPLPRPEEVQDLVIVGGGLTGLWAAYYAALEHPEWSICVIEARQVGYGASGRNGGWLSTLIPGNRAVYARAGATRAAGRTGPDGVARTPDGRGPDGTGNGPGASPYGSGDGPGALPDDVGREAVRSFQREMFSGIDETLAVLAREGIDADQHRGGHLQVATTPAGMHRIRASREAGLEYGYETSDLRLLDAGEVRERIGIAPAVGGLFTGRTARVDPAKLVRGLAAAAARRGVRLCEGVEAVRIDPGLVTTRRGPVRGAIVLSCLEAYGGGVPIGRGEAPAAGRGLLRRPEVIPVNSSMIVTEPLPARTWARIGWEGGECLNDAAHTFVYAQRTADGRIAVGGRGSPYSFGSGTPGDGVVDPGTVRTLQRRLELFFPGVELPIAHAWRGAIGVTRDWCAGVFFDEATRVGVARGYAGHGVTATNVAARTLLDRAAGRDTALTRLPWNDHSSGRWEPEPVRWLGVHGMYRLFGAADSWEEARRSEKTSIIARIGARLTGLDE